MHFLRLAAALPAGALALTLAAPPAAAHGQHGQHGDARCDTRGHGEDRRGCTAGPRSEGRAPGTVSVTGRGESSTAPDMAVISLGVTVQAPSASEAMRENTARQQVVVDTLKARGIEARDIQTSGLNLSPVQDFSREGQPPVITGYQATNMVTVRVRDLPRLGEALDALVGAGANEINGIAFRRENTEALEGDARARAVENARLRAEIMADAAGMELGRLLSITDAAGGGGPQPMMRAMAMDSAAAAPVPIEAGELSLTAEVTATWELRPARRGGGGQPGQHRGGGMGGMGDMGGMGGGRWHPGMMHPGMMHPGMMQPGSEGAPADGAGMDGAPQRRPGIGGGMGMGRAGGRSMQPRMGAGDAPCRAGMPCAEVMPDMADQRGAMTSDAAAAPGRAGGVETDAAGAAGMQASPPAADTPPAAAATPPAAPDASGPAVTQPSVAPPAEVPPATGAPGADPASAAAPAGMGDADSPAPTGETAVPPAEPSPPSN